MPLYLSDTAPSSSGARYSSAGTAVSPSVSPKHYGGTAVASSGTRVSFFGTANSFFGTVNSFFGTVNSFFGTAKRLFDTPRRSRGPTISCHGDRRK
jgi:hypothetical protein